MNKALFYERLSDQRVRCDLCPRECVISPGQRGFCLGKENRAGELYSTIFAQVSSVAIDPIEKKPLYHFYPGSQILSLGTVGCNLRCKFCQNWHIAQTKAPTKNYSSEELIRIALERDVIGIAYTYSEPLIWYEYVLETGKKAKEAGLKNVLVTNGVIKEKPLLELLPYIDAMNLDIKAFQDSFYQQVCGGSYLDQVKKTAELAASHCHLEVTTLLIPGLNDDPAEISALARWLAGLNPDIVLHLSRYFPNHQLDRPPTPIETMEKAREIATEYLHYVYLGNVQHADRNTYCPHCQHLIVDRHWQVKLDLENGKCPNCGMLIPIYR